MVNEDNQKYWNLLRKVNDPEFPISIVDMGLIYGIDVHQGKLEVSMTFTHTSCPCMEWMMEDIRNQLLTCGEITNVEIVVVWEPVWDASKMSLKAKQQLLNWGVVTK
ncbi:metal-sulfur cluster assembly factor [Paenibacillus sp. UMB4589-SE434]|nr:metal-sulfur cluster assembly factor [Paenibacillus sp. UMB4589-SE434]MDK8182745.1 metal-sulfur cluster assembly factor [Paenibacillus sp. UMB4589-SE434]